MNAFLSLEPNTERIAEGLFHRFQRTHGGDLDTGASFTSITGEEGCKVLRRGKTCRAEQSTTQELPDALMLGVLWIIAQCMDLAPKLFFAGRDEEMLAFDSLPTHPGPERKRAIVREKNLAVMLQIVAHLRTALEGGEVFIERLDLDNASFGLELEQRLFARAIFPEFLGRIEPTIGNARAVVGGIDDSTDFGFQGLAHGIEQF